VNRNVIIIGAGGHGKVVADIVMRSGDKVVGFLDDNPKSDNIYGIPVLGSIKDYVKYPFCEFFAAIGKNEIRRKIVESMDNVSWYTAIHPTAVISHLGVSIAEGTVVMANAVINAGTVIGRHVIVNTASVIDHDNKIGDFVHLSGGVTLSGTVEVGENTWICCGVSVSNNISIANDSVVACGAAVVSDIAVPGTYAGVPTVKKK